MLDTEKSIIARGRTAEILVWKDQQVLKLFYAEVSTDSIIRETQVARLISGMNLSTPKLLGEITLGDRYGLIYERVAGESLLACLGTRPWLCIRYARQFAELHTTIHRQRGTGMIPLKPSLENTICGLKGLPPGLLETALDRLARLPEGEMLCHMDFHPEQVMVTATGQFVLDWMTAHSSQPAADVARTIVLLRFGPVLNASWLMQNLINLLRGIFLRTYLRHYLKLNPAVTIAAIEAWLPLVALARLAENIPGEKGKLEAFLRKAFSA